jgi:hypothetical protein
MLEVRPIRSETFPLLLEWADKQTSIVNVCDPYVPFLSFLETKRLNQSCLRERRVHDVDQVEAFR